MSSNDGVQRHVRRLSDKVRVAFHDACQRGERDVAERLFTALDQTTRTYGLGPGGVERRKTESIFPEFKRLWMLLRHHKENHGRDP